MPTYKAWKLSCSLHTLIPLIKCLYVTGLKVLSKHILSITAGWTPVPWMCPLSLFSTLSPCVSSPPSVFYALAVSHLFLLWNVWICNRVKKWHQLSASKTSNNSQVLLHCKSATSEQRSTKFLFQDVFLIQESLQFSCLEFSFIIFIKMYWRLTDELNVKAEERTSSFLLCLALF